MTVEQQNKERLDIALSELEQALDYFDNDEAFVLLVQFTGKLKGILKL